MYLDILCDAILPSSVTFIVGEAKTALTFCSLSATPYCSLAAPSLLCHCSPLALSRLPCRSLTCLVKAAMLPFHELKRIGTTPSLGILVGMMWVGLTWFWFRVTHAIKCPGNGCVSNKTEYSENECKATKIEKLKHEKMWKWVNELKKKNLIKIIRNT